MFILLTIDAVMQYVLMIGTNSAVTSLLRTNSYIALLKDSLIATKFATE